MELYYFHVSKRKMFGFVSFCFVLRGRVRFSDRTMKALLWNEKRGAISMESLFSLRVPRGVITCLVV